MCGPDFLSVGLGNWYLFLKRGACELKISKFGGLWTENFKIWGLVSWKFSNLGACEPKIWVKIEAVKAKIPKFSQKGILWTDSFAWNGTFANYRRGVKRGSSGPHIPISPFKVSALPPPPPGTYLPISIQLMVCFTMVEQNQHKIIYETINLFWIQGQA